MGENTSTEIAKRSSSELAPIVKLNNLDDLMRLADLLAKSKLVPKAYQGQSNDVAVAIMFGHELGLSPIAATQSIAVINGNPGMYGDAPLALVRAKGLLEWIKESYDEQSETWTCRIKRKGEPADVVYEGKFGMPDAKKIDVIIAWENNRPIKGKLADKDTYKNHGKRMCQFRARSFPLRDGFSDVLKGIRQAEEFEEFIETTAEHVVDEPIAMPQRSSSNGAAAQPKGDPDVEDARRPLAAADTIDQRTTASEHPENENQELRKAPEPASNLDDLKSELRTWIAGAGEDEIMKPNATDVLFEKMKPIPESDNDRSIIANQFIKRKQAIWKRWQAEQSK